MPPQLPAPPTTAQRRSINAIAPSRRARPAGASRTRAITAAEETVTTAAAAPATEEIAIPGNGGSAMTDGQHDPDEEAEAGTATVADVGEANPAASPPVLPSTTVFDCLKLKQTCFDHGDSNMEIWARPY